MADFGTRAFWGSPPPHPAPALESISKGCNFGAEIFKFPTVGEISTWETPRRKTNFPTVHIRRKSVTGMVDIGARAFWQPPSPRFRIDVANGAILRPVFPNFQFDGGISMWKTPAPKLVNALA